MAPIDYICPACKLRLPRLDKKHTNVPGECKADLQQVRPFVPRTGAVGAAPPRLRTREAQLEASASDTTTMKAAPPAPDDQEEVEADKLQESAILRALRGTKSHKRLATAGEPTDDVDFPKPPEALAGSSAGTDTTAPPAAAAPASAPPWRLSLRRDAGIGRVARVGAIRYGPCDHALS